MKHSYLTILLYFLFAAWAAAPILYAQDLHDNWELAYKRGLLLLERGELEAAERSFQSILENDPHNSRGYYGLGLILTQANPKSRRAERYFDKAVKLDDSFANAWFQLAKSRAARFLSIKSSHAAFERAVQLNPGFMEAWTFWIETSLDRGSIYQLYSDFFNILSQHPENTALYNLFIETALKYSHENHAVRILKKLRKKQPGNSLFARDLVRMLTFAGSYRESAELLASLKSDSLCSSTFYHRWQALDYWGMADTLNAVDSYQRAWATIRDSVDAHIMAADVQLICKTEEWKKLKTLPPDSLLSFYRVFWRSRDPQPSTDLNERLVDHLYRLDYVNRFCRRFRPPDFSSYDPRQVTSFEDIKFFNQNPGKPKSKDTIVDFFREWQRGVRVGDDVFNALHIKRPMDRSIDDMGLTILRFGQPDVELWSEAQGAIPECTTFFYKATIQHSILVVHYVFLPEAGWTFSSLPLNIVGRGEITSQYRSLEDKLTNFVQLEKNINNASPIVDNVQRYVEHIETEYAPLSKWTLESIKHIVQNEVSSVQADNLKLDLAPISFQGQKNKCELALLYQISRTPQPGRQNSSAQSIRKTIELFTPDYKSIKKVTEAEKVELPAAALVQKKSYIGMVPIYLASGRYIIEMQVSDSGSKKVGVARQEVVIPDYFNSFQVSDILMGTRTLNETSLRREHVTFLPKQLSGYEQSETMTAYLEIYNLTPDTLGFYSYTLSAELNLKENQTASNILMLSVHGINLDELVNSNTVTLKRSLENDIVYLNFRKTDFLTGRFELKVRIRDNNSGVERIRVVPFNVY